MFFLDPVINWVTPAAGNYEAFTINVTETSVPTNTNFLARFQVDTVDVFGITSAGAVRFENLSGSATLPAVGFADAGGVYDTGIYQDITNTVAFSSAGSRMVLFQASQLFGDGAYTVKGSAGLTLGADGGLLALSAAADLVSIVSGTDPQTLLIYESADAPASPTNFTGLSIDAGVTTAGEMGIIPITGGSGAASLDLRLSALGATGEILLESVDAIRFVDTTFQYLKIAGGTALSSSTISTFDISTNLNDVAGTQEGFLFTGGFAPASGTPTDRFFNITPTINWAVPAAGNYSAFFINVTETSVPTNTNYVARLQVDTFDIFRASSRGAVSWGNYDEGGTAAWVVRSSHDLVTLTGATTDTTTISVPSGARLLAVLLNVNTTVVNDGDDTWAAAFVTGSTTTVAAAGTAAAQNTKITLMLSDEITTGIAQIRFTPDMANFTAGVIEVVVYYEELVAMADA